MDAETMTAYRVHVLRVYVSSDGPNLLATALEIASALEDSLDIPGSTLTASHGRWQGKIEPGYVVELAYTGDTDDSRVAEVLHEIRVRSGLTFYVIRTDAQAMEIY